MTDYGPTRLHIPDSFQDVTAMTLLAMVFVGALIGLYLAWRKSR
jgi:hypothetical protein